MNWYYVEEGQQAGPVTQAEFDALVRSGKIRADTLVWREGMAAWQAYRETKSNGCQSGRPSPWMYSPPFNSPDLRRYRSSSSEKTPRSSPRRRTR
jgi:hypothetical protein